MNRFSLASSLIIIAACACFSAHVFADDAPAAPSPAASASASLISRAVFKAKSQSSVMITPEYTDGSTNVAFYLDIGGKMWWQAEQLGSLGDLPFLNYWAPASPVGKYAAVEYVNDSQQFSCSGLSLADCVSDPHFISETDFKIIDDSAHLAAPSAAAATTTDPVADVPSATTALPALTAVPDPSAATTNVDMTASIAQALFESPSVVPVAPVLTADAASSSSAAPASAATSSPDAGSAPGASSSPADIVIPTPADAQTLFESSFSAATADASTASSDDSGISDATGTVSDSTATSSISSDEAFSPDPATTTASF